MTHRRHSGGRAEMIRPILEECQPVREAAAGVGIRERIASKMAGPHQGGRTMQAKASDSKVDLDLWDPSMLPSEMNASSFAENRVHFYARCANQRLIEG